MAEQPRDTRGRFGVKPTTAPEVGLIRAGAAVYYHGLVYRVVDVDGDVVVVRDPMGRKMIRLVSEVVVVTETSEEADRRHAFEWVAEYARDRLRAATHSQRLDLDRFELDQDAAAAYHEILAAFSGGEADGDLFLSAQALSKGQPAAVGHMLVAHAAREQISDAAFAALTRRWVQIMGPLPD